MGPALAARIVAWREQNGAFASVDELDQVSGIGPAMMAKVRDLVTV
ncbi:ComEA family DNA-binding protein [Xylanimonas allomyrinae]|nr:helix-hairpin-helix domain-containing protein [Xylanimonas allomyrinae]